jgi:hypothetical protein
MGNVRDFGYDVNALMRSTKARAVYDRLVQGQCHCDHNIDQSMSLLATGKFRGAVLKRMSARVVSGSEPAASPR